MSEETNESQQQRILERRLRVAKKAALEGGALKLS